MSARSAGRWGPKRKYNLTPARIRRATVRARCWRRSALDVGSERPGDLPIPSCQGLRAWFVEPGKPQGYYSARARIDGDLGTACRSPPQHAVAAFRGRRAPGQYRLRTRSAPSEKQRQYGEDRPRNAPMAHGEHDSWWREWAGINRSQRAGIDRGAGRADDGAKAHGSRGYRRAVDRHEMPRPELTRTRSGHPVTHDTPQPSPTLGRTSVPSG